MPGPLRARANLSQGCPGESGKVTGVRCLDPLESGATLELGVADEARKIVGVLVTCPARGNKPTKTAQREIAMTKRLSTRMAGGLIGGLFVAGLGVGVAHAAIGTSSSNDPTYAPPAKVTQAPGAPAAPVTAPGNFTG